MPVARNQTSGPKGDINVTPLVDVVLVLLIIFMVITPMLQKGHEVQVPVTNNPDKSKSLDEQVTISVDSQGIIYWETQPIDDQSFATRMAELYAQKPGAPIFIKGDVKANYGRIRVVMKKINDAGFESVGVITKDAKEEGHG